MKLPKRGKPVYEGKAKILYPGPDQDTLIQYFKDDVTAFNNKKNDVIAGKGVLNCLICENLYNQLSQIGISTHFIKRLNMKEHLVRRLDIFPIEVVVRNIVAGSLVDRFEMEEGLRLQRSIIEFYHKNDATNDPMISEEHMTAFGWLGPQDIDDITAMSLRINDYLQGLFSGVGLLLVDFKIEFGRHFDEFGDVRILLADEISPDSCRLWDKQTNEKFDKDIYRKDLGGLIKAYRNVANRLGIIKT